MAVNAQGTIATRERGVQKIAAVNVSTATDTALATAPAAGYRIVVLGIYLVPANVSQTLAFKSASNALGGALPCAAGIPISFYSPGGIMVCNAAEALNLTTSHGSQVSGWVTYVEEAAL